MVQVVERHIGVEAGETHEFIFLATQVLLPNRFGVPCQCTGI